MKLLLDTNICIYVIKRKPPHVIERFTEFRGSELGISSVTLSELWFGVEHSSNPEKNGAALIKFLAPLVIAGYDHCAAKEYGRIRSFLQKKGTPIGPLDMMIAAHAISLDITVVTNNVREFSRVPGLDVANWV